MVYLDLFVVVNTRIYSSPYDSRNRSHYHTLKMSKYADTIKNAKGQYLSLDRSFCVLWHIRRNYSDFNPVSRHSRADLLSKSFGYSNSVEAKVPTKTGTTVTINSTVSAPASASVSFASAVGDVKVGNVKVEGERYRSSVLLRVSRCTSMFRGSFAGG